TSACALPASLSLPAALPIFLCAALLRRAALLRSAALRGAATGRLRRLLRAGAAALAHAAFEGVHEAEHPAALLGVLVGLLPEGRVGVHRVALLELRLQEPAQLGLVLVGELLG